jgi:hypothetical protein
VLVTVFTLFKQVVNFVFICYAQVDPFAKSRKQVSLYQFLLSLLKQEDKSRERVRESEEEVH